MNIEQNNGCTRIDLDGIKIHKTTLKMNPDFVSPGNKTKGNRCLLKILLGNTLIGHVLFVKKHKSKKLADDQEYEVTIMIFKDLIHKE